MKSMEIFLAAIGILAVFAILYLDQRYKKSGYIFRKLAELPSVDVRQVAAITVRQKQLLESLQPSIVYGKKYYPCAAKLDNGQEFSCVYFIDAKEHADAKGRLLGFHRLEILIEQVTDILESPYRLPQHLAEELYQQGESAMGAYFFTVEFSNGMQASYSTGDMIDFIDPPTGLKTSDAVKVIPHKILSKNPRPGKDSYRCMYRS